MSDMKILLTADLNIPQSVSAINDAIKEVQKQIIKIHLEVDTTALKNAQVSIEQFTKKTEEQQKRIKKMADTTAKSFYGDETVNSLRARTAEINKLLSAGNKAKVSTNYGDDGKIKSAILEYRDAGGFLVKETMAWKNKVEEVVNEQGETIVQKQRVFQTVNRQVMDDMSKNKGVIEKFLSDTDKKLKNIGLGKSGILDEKKLDEVTAGYTNIKNAMQKLLDTGERISDEEQANTKKAIADIDYRIQKYKQEEKQVEKVAEKVKKVVKPTMDKLPIATSNVGNDFAYRSQGGNLDATRSQIAQQVASIYGREVKPENIAIKATTIDAAGKALVRFTADVETGKNTFKRYSGEVSEVDKELRLLEETMRSTANRNLSFREKFAKAMESIPIWMAGMTAFYQTLHFFTDGVAYVNEFNKSLTQLSIVSGKSQQEIQATGQQIRDLANAMSISTDEVAKGAVEFARQGLQGKEMFDKMGTAIKYAKISNLDFNESAQILTATVNSMGVTADKAADVFSYMGDATATGADELGRAMQRVGGTAGALNIPLEKVSSWIAVVSSKTREGAETIGNSIKTILARVQNLKETGFDETDGTQINDVAKALSSVGIQLVDAHGEFRDFGKVMDELGAKWQGLDKRTQAYIATTVAGTYQQSRFLNLMEGYPQTVQLATDSLNQAGIANKKFALYQEGTEAKLTELKNAWTGIFQDTFNDKGIQSAIEALTGLVSALGKFLNLIGHTNAVVGIATLAFIALSKPIRELVLNLGRQMLNALKSLIPSLRATAAGANSAAVGMNVATTASTGLSRALSILKVGAATAAAAFLPMLALMGIVRIFQAISDSMEKARQRAEALQKQVETVTENWGEHKDTLKALIGMYGELEDKTNKGQVLDADEQQRYNDTVQKLGEMLPNLVTSIDEKGQMHLKSAKAIEEETKQMDLLVEAERKKRQLDQDDMAKSAFDDIQKKRKAYEETRSLANTDISKANQGLARFIPDFLKGVTQKQLKQSLASYQVQVIVDQSALNDSINEAKDIYKGFVDDILKTTNTGFNESINDVFKSLVDGINFSTEATAKEGLEAINALIQQVNYLNHATIQNQDQLSAFLENIRAQAKKLKMSDADIENFINSIRGISDATKEAEFNMKAFEQANDQLNSSYDSSADLVGDLNGLLKEYADNKTVSAEAAAELVKKDASLVDMFKIENGQIKLNIQAIEERRDKELDAFDAIKEARRQDLINANQALNSLLLMYGIQAAAIKTVQDAEEAKAKIEDKQAQQFKDGFTSISDIANDGDKAKDYVTAIEELIKKADILKGGIGKAGTGDGKKDKGSKDKNIEAFDKASADYEKKLDDINQLIDESKSKLGDYSNITKEYRAELAHENKLLGQKQSLMDGELKRLTGLRDGYQKQLSAMGSFSSKWSDDTKSKFNDLSEKVADYNGKINDLKSGWKDAANEIKGNNLEIDSSVIAEFDNRSQELEGTLGNIEAKMNSYPQSSKEYRAALNSQVDVFKKLQKTKADEAKTVREQMKNEKQNSQQWLDHKHLLEQLSTEWWGIAASIDGVTESLKEQNDAANEALLKPQTDRIDELSASLEILQNKMKTYPEDSRDYRLATIAQIDIYKKMEEQVQKNIDSLKAKMATEMEGSAQWEADKKLLLEQQAAWWGLEASIAGVTDALKDQKNKIADDVISAMKAAYEQQKEAVLDGLDAQIKAIDEAHDAQMKALDDQEAGFEKLVNAKKASLQADQEARKYAQDLAKAEGDRAEIQKKIDILKGDTSAAGKKRLAELEKQLAEANMNIDNMQYDHSVELQQNELDNALDAEKERIQNIKDNAEYEVTIKGKTEKMKYDIAIKALNDEKEAQAKYYDSIINDDKKWVEIRNEILAGHVDAVQTAINELETSFTSSTGNIAKYLQDNVIAQLEKVKSALNAVGGSGGSGGTANGNGTTSMSDLDLQKMKDNAEKWKTADAATRKKLEDENKAIGARNGWYRDEKTGVWYRDSSMKQRLFHKGGIVGGVGSAASNLVNKLFNTQPNEEVVKALKGELFAPHNNIVKNFIPNMRNLAGSLARPIPIAGVGGGDININVNVDKLVADDKKSIKRVATDIVTEVKKKGGKI
jgi:TP901 family phage tail tape measure protein